MPLDPPNLDDRTFQDIVDETKRLIPRFTPEWTNHNVSDPGVALIELFAWVSEMVLYRVNQVPDRMYVEFLNLVGIEQFPPSVARTDLTFWLSAPAERVVRVPAGTEVSTSLADADATVFSTAVEGVVGPPELVAAYTSDAALVATHDVWEDLTLPGQAATCFPSTPLTEGDALYLGTRGSLGGYAVRLDLAAQAEGIGVDPRNAPLAWEAWDGEAWVRTIVESDGTGGLNKAGSVVLLVPQRHEPLVLGGTLAHWLRVQLLRPKPGQPTYQASPRIASIALHAIGLTVPAEHARAEPAELLGRSTGVAGQSFRVSTTPVAERRDEEHVVVVDHRGTQAWTEVPDFSASGPARPARGVELDHGRDPVRPDGPAPLRPAAPARCDPPRRCRDPRDRLPLGRRCARQRRRPHPDRAAHRAAVRLRGHQPAARQGRGRRRDRAGGQGPRTADPAHRAARRHRVRLRGDRAAGLRRGGAGPLPARHAHRVGRGPRARGPAAAQRPPRAHDRRLRARRRAVPRRQARPWTPGGWSASRSSWARRTTRASASPR